MTNENSTMAQVVKMKQGMSYSCKEKTIILNVFKYFRNTHPEVCVTEIVRRTAKATGCSEKSVFQFRKEEASVEGFKQPSKTKIRKNININSRFVKYDHNVRQSIRNIIYDLKYRNIVPSLSTILKNVNADEKLPNFSLMTLRRLLSDMGFCYEKEKNGGKPILVEKPAVKKEHLPINKKNNQNENKYHLTNVQNEPPQVKQPPQHLSAMNIEQNHAFLPPPPVLQHNNHFIEPPRDPHLHLPPPNMMMGHRIPQQIHPVSHGMHLKPEVNFIHHGPHYPPNMIVQQ